MNSVKGPLNPAKQELQTSQPRLSQAATDELLISQGSHKSSLAKLQLDELLSEVRPDWAQRTALVQKTLVRLKEIIEGIPHHAAESPFEAEKRLKKAGVTIPFPFPRPAKDVKYKLEYFPPSDINVVGNLALRIGSKVNGANLIDLAITLPSQAFQEKDYLNHRYFHKRAYFVAQFAAAIKHVAKDQFEVAFTLQDDVELQTCIIITPGKSASEDFAQSKARIRIIPAVPDSTFSLDKTNISRNCVRPKGGDDPIFEPTPFYNSCLRCEASVTPYLGYLNKALKTCEALRDACLLGATWLHQRGYDSPVCCGGIGPHEWALVSALLLEGGGPKNRPMFSPRYNSYQLFKGVLQLLASRDLRDPLVIGPLSGEIPRSSSPILYDARRGVNVLFKMNPWSYSLIRHDAQATLEASNDKLIDNFESTFIARLDNPPLRFDQLAHVDLPLEGSLQDKRQALRKLHEVLVKGFNDRTRFVNLQYPAIKSWNLNRSLPTPSGIKVEIGLLLDPENVNRVVDRGPTAEDKEEAEEFRKFWGEKAELRRFRDGTISESLVWSETGHQSIVHQILAVLLSHHFGLPPSAISLVGDQVLRDVEIEPAQQSFQTIIDTFQTFSSKLHALEGLPLAIRSLSAVDEQLRFSSLLDPLKSSRPADIIIQFEGSSRWPDALTAIQRTKIAFLTKIGDLLESADEPLSTRVGLENTHSDLLNVAYLDVFSPNGVLFRLRIHHEREQTLLERQLQDKDIHGRTREEIAQALATYKRDYVHSPRHTQAIRALCTRFPALSSTIRLVKKWICSHLLSSFFTPELLELFAAQVFLRPQPWTIPTTPFTAFLRVLHLISKWDWASTPLILDFSNGDEMSPTDIANITTTFQARRKIDPAMNNIVLFVASNLDPSGIVWTQNSQPPKVVATRLTALARASISAIKDKNAPEFDIRSLFQSPLTHFDFLLHINPAILQQYLPSSSSNALLTKRSSKFKNLQLTHLTPPSHDPETIDFNPISLYINDLQKSFDPSVVLFFHNANGGNVIAGLWNPRTVGETTKEFRVRLGWSSIPIASDTDQGDDKDLVAVNKKAMVAEMVALGEGIVEKVTVLRE
ncbi:putative pre-rrna processing protein utp22 [Phaeomoniella chlamydospora]|uniref:U3 small nucleolar RNA-associated protein 22 n=1 Tax=Phaeomoniella chlamydospora TaxID=158046 RepID=A0A0G2EH95_PHACM|nr:putative pre-rrna processing protein utp22 [Phaeomoniella chlamydospora]